MNMKIGEKLIDISGKILQNRIEKENGKWPPHCIGVLHQPKRPQRQKN